MEDRTDKTTRAAAVVAGGDDVVDVAGEGSESCSFCIEILALNRFVLAKQFYRVHRDAVVGSCTFSISIAYVLLDVMII